MIWKANAVRLLSKKEADENDLKRCVGETPASEEESKEKMLLEERLHCLSTARAKEESVNEGFSKYWDMSLEDLLSQSSILNEFLGNIDCFFSSDSKLENQKIYF